MLAKFHVLPNIIRIKRYIVLLTKPLRESVIPYAHENYSSVIQSNKLPLNYPRTSQISPPPDTPLPKKMFQKPKSIWSLAAKNSKANLIELRLHCRTNRLWISLKLLLPLRLWLTHWRATYLTLWTHRSILTPRATWLLLTWLRCLRLLLLLVILLLCDCPLLPLPTLLA